MEISSANRKLNELKSELSDDTTTTQITSKSSIKRPFDVAFLMLPDEKLKQKQIKRAPIIYENNNEEDEEIEIEDNPRDYKLNQKYFTQKQQIFDDPNSLKSNIVEHQNKFIQGSSHDQKSAFTKVNNNNNNTQKERGSPNLSLSPPDLTYQSSLSPSPPIMRNNYQQQNFAILSPGQIFKNEQLTYQANFLPENFPHPATSIQNHFLKNQSEFLQPNFKIRPMYRPDLASYNYQQFPAAAAAAAAANQEVLKSSSNNESLKFSNDQMSVVRNPAAAILTSLLPPSLAALSMPAQNVCAKCNITFRMTSDLVYHMRSHHKSETSEISKRRREEKLKCPVCSESFRERHHLTRHMTAHQDKDEDENEGKKVRM